MGCRRGLTRAAFLSWLLASLATAAVAHALIAIVAHAGIAQETYGRHEHGAVLPVAFAAVILAVSLLLRSALRTVRRSHTLDDVAILAHRCATVRPAVPGLTVAAGGFATLLAIEFGEQFGAFGHIEGIADALGGNGLLGLAIVLVVAALVTVVGLRSASALLSTAVAAVGAIVDWIRAASSALAAPAIVGQTGRRPERSAPTFIERCFGMRAPPLPALV
jgi:hypothetical protein